jgi:energy-coupling factor transporter ATP-binding protein EcfA2
MAEIKAGNPYPSNLRLFGNATLIGILSFIVSEPLSVVFGIIVFVIVIVISIYIFRRRLRKDIEPSKESLAIVGFFYFKETTGINGMKWREGEKVSTWIKDIEITQYIASKANSNIAIIGTAGSGKTELTYFMIRHLNRILPDRTQIPLRKVIFQYKAGDKYKQMGFPTLMLKDSIPNVFADTEAFVQSWLCAFPIGSIGITASKVPAKLRDILSKTKNFDQFSTILEDLIKHERDSTTLSALVDIRDKLSSIYQPKMIDYDIPDEVVLDFEGLNSSAFVFFAEYLLRQLYREIIEGKRQQTIIMLDEAGLFATSRNTIIPEIARIIRATGALLLATQRLDDIAGIVLDNCDTQFTSIQSGAENMKEIPKTPLWEYSIRSLNKYEFVDLRQKNSERKVYIWQLLNPSKEFHEVRLIESKNKLQSTEAPIDYRYEIETMLSEKARNINELSKILAQKFRQNDSVKNRNHFKTQLMPYLEKMLREDEISKCSIENIRFSDRSKQYVEEKIYYLQQENLSKLHDYLVEQTSKILTHFNKKFKIMPTNRNTADIEGEDFAIEVETGLKHSTNDLEERIKKYENEGKKVIVIIPNSSLKDRYPNGITLKEFAEVVGK